MSGGKTGGSSPGYMRFVQSYCPPRVTQCRRRSRTCLMERGLCTAGSLGVNIGAGSGGYEKKDLSSSVS
ncbi:hypothetical protein HYQ46_003648 [Verticillium longisporum]|nr:hypothetical protein HYQ46_003648 [Verticillium longisporum]